MWIISLIIPALFIALVVRRKIQKKRFYAQTDDGAPIEGTLEELNAVDPKASPWTSDERAKLNDTKELVARFNTGDGYSQYYVDDLLKELRSHGIECETLFQETLPMGVAMAIVDRIGTFEIFVDRARAGEALQRIEEFKAR